MTETEFHAINSQPFIAVGVLCSDEYHQMEKMLEKRRLDEATAAIHERRATFDDLVTVEPCLQWLADDATAYHKSHGRKHRRCANNRWYGYHEWEGLGIKARLKELVGTESRYSKVKIPLRSSYAWNLAYDHLYELLPTCRGCNCY